MRDRGYEQRSSRENKQRGQYPGGPLGHGENSGGQLLLLLAEPSLVKELSRLDRLEHLELNDGDLAGHFKRVKIGNAESAVLFILSSGLRLALELDKRKKIFLKESVIISLSCRWQEASTFSRLATERDLGRESREREEIEVLRADGCLESLRPASGMEPLRAKVCCRSFFFS